jgi:DNA-binding NarL/FixJ family response regulator
LKKDLTNREQEVLRLLAEGRGNRQIAEQLGISVRTVEGHRARVMLKLGLTSLSELIRYAVRQKIVEV